MFAELFDQAQEKQEKVVEFDRAAYKDLCDEMKDLLQLEKEIAHRKKELRDEIIEASNGERMENGIRLSRKVREGSVDYKKMATDFIDEKIIEEMLPGYKKESVEYWEVRSY